MMKKALVAALITALAALAPISAFAMETPAEYASSAEETAMQKADEVPVEYTSAEEEATTQKADEVPTEYTSAEEEKIEENAAENDTNSEGIADENIAEKDVNSDEKADENSNQNDVDNASGADGFEAFYALIMEHLSEILSLCAFAASLVCAAVYKSGLLPLIERSLNAIGSTTQKIRESAELGEDKRRADIEALSEKLSKLEASLGELTEDLCNCTERMEEKSTTAARERRMEALITGELEMLYDIFMSSALPEYEKTRVGERVAKMKEVISSDEKD